MEGGLWDDYDRETGEGFESADRGSVTSELELSDSELAEVEEALGFGVDEAIDSFEQTEFESSEYQTEAGVRPSEGEVVLEGSRDMPAHTLAHESVHGMMMQPGAENYLPGDNGFEQTLYDEFVARMAEDEIQPLQVSQENLRELQIARKEYFNKRAEYEGEVFPEEFETLYDDALHTDRIVDTEVQHDIDRFMGRYQALREQVLASQAAKEYKQENDVDLGEFIKPDRKLYEETIGYIKDVEDGLEERI